jgi:hypothetical protein
MGSYFKVEKTLTHMEVTIICQIEHHVRYKFATPILYTIDNFINYNIISKYT